MSARLMYSGAITYADYLIATRDEVAIEEEAEEIRAGGVSTNYDRVARAELTEALRKIDLAKVGGQYDGLRAALRAEVEAEAARAGHSDRLRATQERLRSMVSRDDWQSWAESHANFLAGLKSSDPEQRNRFQSLYLQMGIADWDAHDNPALFAALERAKMRKGRPEIRPAWRNENANLDAMRVLCAEGYSIPAAARSVAGDEGLSQADSRAKYFENLYRAKMRLRK